MASSTHDQLVVSPRAIGITVLHEGALSTVDVICVHGINSTPSQCWQKGIVLWPRDLLPREIDDTRIATFGYNSSVLEEASIAKIRDHARDLLQDLLDNRKGQVAQRPIIFVCHCLGGIVVKQALVMAHVQPKFESIKNTTYGIIFLGTPHRGSGLASLGETVAKTASVAFGKRKIQTQLLKTLRENSQQLQDLAEEFTELHSLYKIVTCFEQKRTAFSKRFLSKIEMIVPESSAKLAIEGETLVAMNTDHRNICKFDSSDDSQYIKVKNRIAELVNMAPDAVKARLKPAARAVLSSVNLTQDAGNDPDFQDAKSLSEELGGVPLVLEQAEAYMLHNPMRFRDYLTLYNKNPTLLDHLPMSSEWAYEKNKTVFRTLQITCSTLTPIARNLLSFLAFLDPSHITCNILERLGSSEDSLQSLASQTEGRLANIQLLIGDEVGFGQAIACLSRFCLVNKLPMPKTNAWRFDIHPLVHQWSRFSLGGHRQEVSIFVASSLALVVKGIEEKQNKGKTTGKPTWVSTSILLPHVNFSMRQLPHFDIAETPLPAWFRATQFIAEKFAWFYWKGKHLTEAAQLYEQVLGGMQICENMAGEDKLQLSKIGESLGQVLWELGDLDRAEAHVKHALDSKVEVLGWQHDSVVKTAEILRRIQEKNHTITAMEERSRNAASVAKIAPGTRIDDRELETEMTNEEWHFYQIVEDSIELLGRNDKRNIKFRFIPSSGGAEVNAQGGRLGNALQAAAREGHQIVVQLLLDSGAEVNAQGGEFGNALQAAARNGHQTVVQLLLDNRAEVNAQSGEFGNTLQATAGGGHQTVVQLLLDNGAKGEIQGGAPSNALEAASNPGVGTAVQPLDHVPVGALRGLNKIKPFLHKLRE